MTTATLHHWHVEPLGPDLFCGVDDEGHRTFRHFFTEGTAQTYVDQQNALLETCRRGVNVTGVSTTTT